MLLGVCDGVSQLEEFDPSFPFSRAVSIVSWIPEAFTVWTVWIQEFQMDPSLLPNELLRTCEDTSCNQLGSYILIEMFGVFVTTWISY